MMVLFPLLCIVTLCSGENGSPSDERPLFPLARVIFPPEPLNEPTASAATAADSQNGAERIGVITGGDLLTARPAATSPPSTSRAKPQSTTTDAPLRTCAPFISSDRVVYRNRCVTKDGAAQCTMTIEQVMCKCSSGWTGPYCESREDQQTATISRRMRLLTNSSPSTSIVLLSSSNRTSSSSFIVTSLLITAGAYVSLM